MKALATNFSWDAIWSLPPSEFLSLVVMVLLCYWVANAIFWRVVRFFNP